MNSNINQYSVPILGVSASILDKILFTMQYFYFMVNILSKSNRSLVV